MRGLFAAAGILLGVLAMTGCAAPPADLVIVNARVWTGREARPEAEAIAVEGERIAVVGSEAEARRRIAPDTQVIDAAGRRALTVTPSPGVRSDPLQPVADAATIHVVRLRIRSAFRLGRQEGIAVQMDGKAIDFDKDGFMIDPSLWDESVASAIAAEEGIAELCDKHWGIVNFIRSYWKENDLAPPVRLICQEVGVSVREIYKLFTSGPARGACRVAGLPKPDGCV